MKGIKLTTGETIGRWSLDDHDGKREAVSGGDNPSTTKLPRGEAPGPSAPGPSGPSGAAVEDAEADAFAGR